MLTLILCAQIAAATPVDSTYSSTALRDLVARAAAENRLPPAALKAYKSRIETELSLLVRDTLGRERSAEVEQIATDASWTRGDKYDLHIVGYRSQNVGVPYSTLSLVRAWTVPTLYGERLSLGAYLSRSRRTDSLIAVHPFSSDRDKFYRFSGGDTVATLRMASRTISVVRIHVRPNLRGNTRLGAFDGEIDLDVERAHIVRMRGQLVVLGGASDRRSAVVQRVGVVAAAYVEFVNAEINGAYWLPTFQRTEFQASFPLFGRMRPVFRIVSTIGAITVTDTGTVPAAAPGVAVGIGAAEPNAPRVNVTWAPSDSVSAFAAWTHEIGTLSSSVHADDFDDVAPDAWRTNGPPRIDILPTNMTRVLRFNRVEGLFTGLAPSIDFRTLVPGLTAGVFGGWAWAEHTARGGAFVSRRRGNAIYGIRAERSLASTNDFEPPLGEDPGFSALLGSLDNYDYVDRRSAALSLTRVLGSLDRGLATVQFGVANDRSERKRLSRGLFGADDFRSNRGVDEGTSFVSVADLELHPNVGGEFVEPGVGGRLHLESGRGDLDWTRAEVELSVRKYIGPYSFAAQADGGLVAGSDPPPQQLFELGGDESLPGYDYKEFAGDRAALFRTFASYRFGIWQRPQRIWRNYMIPGISPGIAASVQGGWTEFSSAGAVRAASRLINGAMPIPRGTNGVRATVGAGLTFFSDIVHIGVARPMDRASHVRVVAGFGTAF
jgi:hypothetical protein